MAIRIQVIGVLYNLVVKGGWENSADRFFNLFSR